MTATPAYGFRIRGGQQPGPMQRAIGAGNVADIQNLLTKRFPGLQFEALGEEVEEVEKPEETVSEPTTLATDLADETAKEETTASLYGDYMAGLPGGVRELITTDYKGVRGGRLGRGNYTTESIIPGAQVKEPETVATPSAATAAAPTPAYTTTTYNYTYNYPQETMQPAAVEQPQTDVPTSGPTTTTTTTPTTSFTPAWAKSNKQEQTTIKRAASGLVPSTTQRGVYVAPSSPEAPTTAQNVSQAVESRIERGTGLGIKAAAAAAGDPNKIGANAAAAIIAAPGSDRKAAEKALQKAERGKIELTNAAKKALKKAAKKKK